MIYSKDRDLLETMIAEEEERHADFSRQVQGLHWDADAVPRWRVFKAARILREIRAIQSLLLYPSQHALEELKRELIDVRAAERESRRTT